MQLLEVPDGPSIQTSNGCWGRFLVVAHMDRGSDSATNPEHEYPMAVLKLEPTKAEGWCVFPQGKEWVWHWGQIGWGHVVMVEVNAAGQQTGKFIHEWRAFATPLCSQEHHIVRWHGTFPAPDRPFPHRIDWTCPTCTKRCAGHQFRSILDVKEARQEPI